MLTIDTFIARLLELKTQSPEGGSTPVVVALSETKLVQAQAVLMSCGVEEVCTETGEVIVWRVQDRENTCRVVTVY